MEEQKPVSVRTVGILVAVGAAMIIFSNGLGGMAFSFLLQRGDPIRFPEDSAFNFLQFLIENFVYFSAGMVLIGMLYFIGGLTLRKYKLWANQLTTYLSILLLALIWIVTIAISSISTETPEIEVYRIMRFFAALFWSTPLGLLIWFLNRQDIKKHFA